VATNVLSKLAVSSQARRALPALGSIVVLLVLAFTAPIAAAGVDDYPSKLKSKAKDAVYDPWKFYNRECTSFVAWRLNSRNHVAFNDYYRGPKWSHAKYWDNVARSLKIPVNGTPAVGAVAQTDAGSMGHVAWVESVNSNGTVTIEEYNRANTGRYSERKVSKALFSYIHIKDIKPKAKPKPKATPKPKSTPTQAPSGFGDSTGFYEPGPAGWHLSNALAPGSSDYIFARGQAGAIPVVGDWDGDGRDSTGFYDPGPAGWHLSNALAPGSSDYIFARGKAGVIPVVGDWDGDGRDSTGFYEPEPAGWHLSNSLAPGSSDYIFSRGAANSIPVVGDWDGDGRDSTGAYYPWDQSWHLSNSLAPGSSDYIFIRGSVGSIPVVGNWDGK